MICTSSSHSCPVEAAFVDGVARPPGCADPSNSTLGCVLAALGIFNGSKVRGWLGSAALNAEVTDVDACG